MILRLKIYGLLLKIVTYSIPFLVFKLGWWLWMALSVLFNRPGLYPSTGHLSQILFGIFVWAVFAEHYRVTSFDELFRERTGARAAWSACMATSFVLLATLFFSRNDVFPRGLLVCDIIVLLIVTILLRAVFRITWKNRVHLSKPSRLLVIGADEFALNSAVRLQRLSFSPCEIAGYVRLPGQEVCVSSHRVYELEQLSLISFRHAIDEAVIAVPAAQFPQIPQIISILKHLCLPVRAIVDLGEGVVVREKLFQLGNLQMLDLTSTPTESLDYAVLKRGFDIAFSTLVLVLAFPLFALIALLVRLSSSGPVFFVQDRIGLNGIPFRMYKFRTMRAAPQSESDTRWTTGWDPRRTSLGVFLRKTSLDELPQFINVLRGEMSVVGPRPERPHFVQEFLQNVTKYNHRHALKVGITGWAQVNGWRGDTSIEKRVEYDLYYLQNWSLGLDLRIIALTALSVVIQRNAY